MANSPQPQPLSYQQLLGNSVNTLLTKLGLSGLTVGGPLLSVMETVATGQARTNADLFAMLASQDLDNCTGTALINRGADEGLTPINATYAQQNNLVITDTSFTPITSSVYQGAPAPIAGSSAVVILTNTSFPSTGAIYIGRGTLNYEGPLNYSSITNSGAYSTINLTTPTTRYHNKGESVILSQGGSRLIQTGTICSTQPNNNVSVAQYSILNDYTILDGDNTLGGIAIIALNPGSGGNAAAIQQETVCLKILPQIRILICAALHIIFCPSADNHRLPDRANNRRRRLIGNIKRVVNRRRNWLLAHIRQRHRIISRIEQRGKIKVGQGQRRSRTLAGISSDGVIQICNFHLYTATRRQRLVNRLPDRCSGTRVNIVAHA